MFPDYERAALDTLLRANGKCYKQAHSDTYIDNMLNQTIECILTTGDQGGNAEADHPKSNTVKEGEGEGSVMP